LKKFQTEWFKTFDEFKFPEGMPREIQVRAINRRRQILIHSYIQNGVGMEMISQNLFGKISKELEDIQAAWGTDFNFYDYLFDGWDITQEDQLITNRGIDEGIVHHAMELVNARKARERKLAY
jgi:hypothetical protein